MSTSKWEERKRAAAEKRRLENERIRKAMRLGTTDNDERNRARLQRIRSSLDRINRLMEDIRNRDRDVRGVITNENNEGVNADGSRTSLYVITSTDSVGSGEGS